MQPIFFLKYGEVMERLTSGQVKCRVLCFLFVLVAGADLPIAAGKNNPAVNCDIQHRSCTQNLSTLTVTLDITPRPVKAMADLVFRVRLDGPQPAKTPYIDLGMPGMKMGPNHVDLKAVGPGIYEGKGVIVRCPSGRNRWRATITVPGAGSADFIFDVVY